MTDTTNWLDKLIQDSYKFNQHICTFEKEYQTRLINRQINDADIKHTVETSIKHEDVGESVLP